MSIQQVYLIFLIAHCVACISCLPAQESHSSHQFAGNKNPHAMSVVSDDDLASQKQIKYHIGNGFTSLKTIDEALSLLDKVRLLIQKHPKNVASASGNMRELHNFLSNETITKLARVDVDPFLPPLTDDKIALAQHAVDEDELTRTIFGVPLRSVIESRKQSSKSDSSQDKDSNFFQNFWCKLSGSCTNQ